MIKAVNFWQELKRWLDRHAAAADISIAAILAIIVLLNLWVDLGSSSSLRLWAGILLILATTLPLALRRRTPLAVLAAITAGVIALRQLGFPESPFTEYCLLLAFVSAGIFAGRPWRARFQLISAAATLVSLAYAVFLAERIFILPVQAVAYKVSLLLFEMSLFVAAWWVGEVFRIRREHELELEKKNILLEEDAADRTRRAVIDERIRIARELHDVVAHHVSVMGIQAGAARRIMSRQPERVSELLIQVEESSRQAIAELHRLLGFLRGEGPDQIAPQPVLSEIGTLLGQMRSAGLDVKLTMEGSTAGLPPTLELSAYRIIQEALTNTLKHASAAKAEVKIKSSPGRLEVEILDDGPGDKSQGSENKGGRGIIGMRERVALYGGEFIAGNAPAGGFLVRAIFPYGRPEA